MSALSCHFIPPETPGKGQPVENNGLASGFQTAISDPACGAFDPFDIVIVVVPDVGKELGEGTWAGVAKASGSAGNNSGSINTLNNTSETTFLCPDKLFTISLDASRYRYR